MLTKILNNHPKLNILINNAGAKTYTDLLAQKNLNAALNNDFALNLISPIKLSQRLLPHFNTQKQAAIINITSGLVHLPKAEQAFYCAAKAALHSYSQSLRWALKNSNIHIYEILMPLVNSNFHQGLLPSNIKAMSPEKAANLALKGVLRGKKQISFGKSVLTPWLALLAPSLGMRIINR